MTTDPMAEALMIAHPERAISQKEEISPDKDEKEPKKALIHNPNATMCKRILVSVTHVSNYTSTELTSVRREKRLVYWRHIAGFLIKRHTNYSFPRIGNVLGGRDHTTVMHGCQKIQNDYESYREDIERVESFL